MIPDCGSLRSAVPAIGAVSDGFGEEVMQQLALEEAQDLNRSWGFRGEHRWGVRTQEEARGACSNGVGTGNGSAWLLMITEDEKDKSMIPF